MIKGKLICIVLSVLLLLTGCSNSTSKDTINTNNSSTEKDEVVQQLESDHFVFYSKIEDKNVLKDLSKTLEDNYERITKDLTQPLKSKVNVYIYPDLDTFHKAIGESDAPEWVVGTATPSANKIQMVNPSNAGGQKQSDVMKIVVHEFTHIVVGKINSNVSKIPIWLNDGVATYEAGQDESTDKVLADVKKVNKYHTLKNLESMGSYDFGKKGGYQFSYLYVKYIVDEYGYDKLVALIKQPSQFKNILGVTQEDFEKAWFSSLK
jgi:hypothetical protein